MWLYNSKGDHILKVNNYPILTRNLHSKRVAADADEVEGHTLDSHPTAGWPHCEDALHLHGPVLLPLDLHRWSLERNRHLHPCGVFIAPASLKHIRLDKGTQPWTLLLHFYTLAHCKIVWLFQLSGYSPLCRATYVGRIPKHWYQMILGAG